jgi:hypothetical protein
VLSSAALLEDSLDRIDPDDMDEVSVPRAPQAYRRATLYEDGQVEVVAARWVAGGQSSLHGHGDSAAMYRVLLGAVEEERYVPSEEGYRHEVSVLNEGEQTYLPPGSYHRLRAIAPSVTLHAYSPPPANPTAAMPDADFPDSK